MPFDVPEACDPHGMRTASAHTRVSRERQWQMEERKNRVAAVVCCDTERLG